MEIKEAIEALRFYQRKLYNGIYKEKIGAFDIAISALEKQIPEPPEVAEGNDADGFWRPDMFFCPTCRKVIDTCEHHCICGQKIDWEDELEGKE